MLSNCVVVIRTTGERTLPVLKAKLLEEVSINDLHIVQEEPFEKALQSCYRIGLQSGKKWLITFDADILPKKNILNELLRFSKTINDNVFMYNGYVYDKFMLKYRRAGYRVFKTKALEMALSYLPEPGNELRPESYVINKMLDKGYVKKNFQYFGGLHDYYQKYEDIYRTVYLHSNKHFKRCLNVFDQWVDKSKIDYDYIIAIRAFSDAIIYKDKAITDSRFYKGKYELARSQLDLIEKSNISLEKYSNYYDIISSLPEFNINKSFYSKLKGRIFKG